MSLWHQVVIPNNDLAPATASSLMNSIAQAWRTADCPVDAEVFHPRDENMDHVYYFSPAMSAIARDLLQKFSAVSCDLPKNFAIEAFKVRL